MNNLFTETMIWIMKTIKIMKIMIVMQITILMFKIGQKNKKLKLKKKKNQG